MLDLVKVGADKAQETIKDYQNKQSKVSDDKKAEDVKEEKSEEAEETKLPILIHGAAYKPDVPYQDGSY